MSVAAPIDAIDVGVPRPDVLEQGVVGVHNTGLGIQRPPARVGGRAGAAT